MKGKFKEMDLNQITGNKNVREYMIRKTLMHDSYRQNDVWFTPRADYQELPSKEIQDLVSVRILDSAPERPT